MSILIKGMEMPKSCEACNLRVNRSSTNVPDFVCIATGGLTFYCSKSEVSKRQKVSKEYLWDCPLIPVPPHGRLIDADALENEGADVHEDIICCGYVEDSIWGFSHEMIEHAPTIIEAEEGEG